jgi:cell division septum initiation protein DivIVA
MIVKNEEGQPVGICVQPMIALDVADVQRLSRQEFKRMQALMLQQLVMQVAEEIDDNLNELAFTYKIEAREDDLPRIVVPGILRG